MKKIFNFFKTTDNEKNSLANIFLLYLVFERICLVASSTDIEILYNIIIGILIFVSFKYWSEQW